MPPTPEPSSALTCVRRCEAGFLQRLTAVKKCGEKIKKGLTTNAIFFTFAPMVTHVVTPCHGILSPVVEGCVGDLSSSKEQAILDPNQLNGIQRLRTQPKAER